MTAFLRPTRRALVLVCVALLLTLACTRERAPRVETEGADGPRAAPSALGAAPPADPVPGQAAQVNALPATAAGHRQFGAPMTGDAEPLPLAALLDQPERYTGQVVRTEGEISAVCQRMGCWMELRDEHARAVRVPMAGHAFFLPRDVAGQRAVVEGPLSVRPLGAAEREHLAGEGAGATDVALELSATSVLILAPAG